MSKRRLSLTLLVALGLASCRSVPADPATNVSAASYRATLQRVQENLSRSIVPRLRALRDDDLSSSSPRHSEDWWNAQIGLVGSDTAALISDTLAGSTLKAPPK